jgi:hypothetical protein
MLSATGATGASRPRELETPYSRPAGPFQAHTGTRRLCHGTPAPRHGSRTLGERQRLSRYVLAVTISWMREGATPKRRAVARTPEPLRTSTRISSSRALLGCQIERSRAADRIVGRSGNSNWPRFAFIFLLFVAVNGENGPSPSARPPSNQALGER